MTRAKRANPPVAFLSLAPEDRRAVERAASLLNVPLAQLVQGPLQASQDADASSLQRVTDLTGDDADGVHDNDNDNDQLQDNDKDKDSTSEEDIATWHSSAAEFNNIDDDITREYENVDPWAEDFPVLGLPATGPTYGSTPGHISKGTPASVNHGSASSAQSSWDLSQSSLQYASQTSVSSLESLAGFAPNVQSSPVMHGNSGLAPLQQSWALVDKFQPARSPQASRQSSFGIQTPGWTVTAGFVEASGAISVPDGEDTSSDGLRFVPVDPLQPQSLSRPQRRGPFQDRDRQEETGRTRGLKACVRCRMQKIRCSIVEDNPSGICGTCLAVSKQKVHVLPCLRHRLTECTLYRTGKAPGLEFTFRWPVMKLKDITDWENTQLRTILVQSDVCEIPLKLVVRKFVPIPHKDSIHRSWVDHRRGVKKFKRTTPYAVVNMKNAVHDMREYVTQNVFSCMDYFLRGSDQLIKETYEFARKHMQRVESDEERKLLGNFFRLWFAIRRTATTEHIVGDEVLDMEPETVDQSYPLFGKIPLPPVMIQQLDMILTLGILEPLRKQVLEDFQKLVLATNPKNWMTVYLVTFMSLHSCAKITAENYHNARKHGLLRRYAIPNFIAERHHSANVFLSHYHYRTESSSPFKQDWKRRHMTPFSHMSVDDIQFLERTKVLLKEKEDIIKTNNENDLYEHELYFVSQMFEENWQPRETFIDRGEGTINDVGLKEYAAGAGEKGT